MTFYSDVPWGSLKRAFVHAEAFWRLRCAPDLLESGLFPNMKEVTESMAAIAAAHKWAPRELLDEPSVSLVAVGDGVTPRTAALAAFRSRWTCHSIDPMLSRVWMKPTREAAIKGIDRLSIHPYKAQEMPYQLRADILLAVHSHATIPQAMVALSNRPWLIVAIPCCVGQQRPIGYETVAEYHDHGIWSPQNKVMVWRDLLGEREDAKATNLS